MMNKKFIINNGQLITGHVETHSELVNGFDDTRVSGGGLWYLDKRKGIVHLYADSEVYGRASLEDVKKAVESGYMTGFQETFKYAYSNLDSLEGSLKDFVILERKG